MQIIVKVEIYSIILFRYISYSNLVSIQYRISVRVDTSYINNFSVNFWQPNLHAIKKYHVRYTLSSLG